MHSRRATFILTTQADALRKGLSVFKPCFMLPNLSGLLSQLDLFLQKILNREVEYLRRTTFYTYYTAFSTEDFNEESRVPTLYHFL